MRYENLRNAHDRITPRRAITVQCQAVAEDGFRLLGDTTLDLSEHGAMVRSDVYATLGEVVLFSFRAPASSDWIDTEAEVARVIAGRREGDAAPAIGLRFTHIEAMDRIVLRERLRRIPPTLPQRHRRKDYAGFVRNVDFMSPANLKQFGFAYLAG